MEQPQSTVSPESGATLRFGALAKTHGAKMAAMITGKTIAGVVLGMLIGVAAFAVPYALGWYSVGSGAVAYAVWLLLPAFVVLGSAAYGYAGFRLGTGRAGTYLLIDTGYLGKLVGSLVERIMVRAKATSAAQAIESSVKDALSEDDDARSNHTMLGGFLARLKARVFRLVKAQLAERFPEHRDMDSAARALVVDKIVEAVRDRIESIARGAARLWVIVATAIMLAVPALFLALG